MQRASNLLSRQLLILVMGYTLLLSIPVGLANVWITYRQEAARQQEQVDTVRALFGLQLANAVWEFDQAAVQRTLSRLDRFPALQRVEVVSPDIQAVYVKKGSKPEPADKAQAYPLMAPSGDMEIGRLRLNLDTTALRERVWEAVRRVIAVMGVEMLLFAILIFGLMRRSVTLPVLALSTHVRNMTPDRLDEPAPLPREKARNELHELADGVTRLQHALREQLAQRDEISRTLKESEARLQMIADGTPNQLWSAHPDGALDYVSKSARSFAGTDAEQFLGSAWMSLVHPDDLPRCTAQWSECMSTGAMYQIDCRLRRFDGAMRWHSLMAVPQRDESGTIVKWFGSSTDIHDRKEAERALDQHRIQLEREVAERTAALSAAKETAEAASRAKSTFLANMSHEIRTPLNAIVGLAQLMRGKTVQGQEAERLDAIQGAGEHLLSVINDILDLSKIEAGRMALEQVDFSIDQLMNGVVSIVGESARDKGLMLTVDTDAVPRWLRGDVTRLRQALLNYVGNGVKFTAQGSVALRAKLLHQAGDELLLRFEVQDTGIGVAPEKLPMLFQPFEQADASTTRQYGGTGLGLAMAKGIAELMGGEAGAQSTVGAGSTFWFTAKVRQGQAISLPSSRDAATVEGETAQQLLRHAGACILVAEDNALNRVVAEGMLTAVGMKVELAHDGLEALTKARETAYDLILMDMQMPVMNGLEATRAIRTLPGWAHKPIVAMTANAFGEDRANCLAAGMNDFITKPVDMGSLHAMVARWLSAPEANDAPDAPISPV